MSKVDESGQHLTDIIGEISSASQQQAAGLDQVNGAITQMDEGTQQNAAMAEETSAVAASMSEQAKKLTDMISVFKIQSNAGGYQQPVARTPVASAAAAGAGCQCQACGPRPAAFEEGGRLGCGMAGVLNGTHRTAPTT